MLDEEKLKELLAGCFQDVIISLSCNEIGNNNVVRLIDIINGRIQNANLEVVSEAG